MKFIRNPICGNSIRFESCFGDFDNLPKLKKKILYGIGGSTTTQLVYTVDWIDVSSFCKPTLFQKAADFYSSGHSLNEVAQKLNVPKSSVRDALIGGGFTLRPHNRDHGPAAGHPLYGYARVAGELVEDQREQKIIQLMLLHWRSGKTFTDVAKLLNQQKIRPRLATKWSDTTVRNIILRHKNK